MAIKTKLVVLFSIIALLTPVNGQRGACTVTSQCGECAARDCDKDSECTTGLLCADAHKSELNASGFDPRKAYCGKDIGKWNWELCYDPTKVGGNRVVSTIVTGNSNDLQVSSCSSTTVEIKGSNVTSIQILTTTYATFKEVFADDVFDLSLVGDTPIEPLFNCGYDSRRLLLSDPNSKNRRLQAFPNTCPDWFALNSDGRCRYTDCFVGQSGNPTDCFVCKATCDNTCGAEDGIKVSGNFGLYDFGQACCIHDHCYNSVFGQSTCDSEFLSDMLSACPIINPLLIRIIGPIAYAALQGACPLTALLFYGLVSGFGADAYNSAQANQKAYEKTPVCIAKCPTTQTAGGQGGTRLVIDLIKTSGSFPVQYQMYTIPDQLTITYEGKTIFDTGGLVSGSASVDVSYSGNTTIIEAVVYAPEDGTAWNIFIGCPLEP